MERQKLPCERNEVHFKWKTVCYFSANDGSAMQHYQTALRRFETFPVNIVLLSRYNSPKQTKENLKKIRSGVADLVIGTHRVVQKDVQFKALGLAIVDEEQRFGVAHKENSRKCFRVWIC